MAESGFLPRGAFTVPEGRKPGSAHDGKIFPLYFTPGSHDGKNTAAYHMLGDDCQTRGISVKPVDAAEYERHALG